MTEDEIQTALAQVYSLPKIKRSLLLDSYSTKYYVQMTFPYCHFVREESGHDLFYTFDLDEATKYRIKMKEKHPLCDYKVFSLRREEQ